MVRAKFLGLADYLLLLRREWAWGLKLFGLFAGMGTIGVWVGWQFQPTANFVATAVILVSEKAKERTMAQLGSHAWAQQANVEPPMVPSGHISIKGLPGGLIRLDVESTSRENALKLAERLIIVLRVDRQTAWLDRVPILETVRKERAALSAKQDALRYQELTSEITRLQTEQADLVVEVIDPPTVTSLPAHRPVKSLLSLWLVALLVSLSGIFVREWWRLEMRKRKGRPLAWR